MRILQKKISENDFNHSRIYVQDGLLYTEQILYQLVCGMRKALRDQSDVYLQQLHVTKVFQPSFQLRLITYSHQSLTVISSCFFVLHSNTIKATMLINVFTKKGSQRRYKPLYYFEWCFENPKNKIVHNLSMTTGFHGEAK